MRMKQSIVGANYFGGFMKRNIVFVGFGLVGLGVVLNYFGILPIWVPKASIVIGLITMAVGIISIILEKFKK